MPRPSINTLNALNNPLGRPPPDYPEDDEDYSSFLPDNVTIDTIPPSERAKVQDEVASILLASGRAAATYIQNCLRTGKSDPVLLRAAKDILDRINGRPAQRQERDESIDRLTSLWSELRDARVEDAQNDT